MSPTNSLQPYSRCLKGGSCHTKQNAVILPCFRTRMLVVRLRSVLQPTGTEQTPQPMHKSQ